MQDGFRVQEFGSDGVRHKVCHTGQPKCLSGGCRSHTNIHTPSLTHTNTHTQHAQVPSSDDIAEFLADT